MLSCRKRWWCRITTLKGKRAYILCRCCGFFFCWAYVRLMWACAITLMILERCLELITYTYSRIYADFYYGVGVKYVIYMHNVHIYNSFQGILLICHLEWIWYYLICTLQSFIIIWLSNLSYEFSYLYYSTSVLFIILYTLASQSKTAVFCLRLRT